MGEQAQVGVQRRVWGTSNVVSALAGGPEAAGPRCGTSQG